MQFLLYPLKRAEVSSAAAYRSCCKSECAMEGLDGTRFTLFYRPSNSRSTSTINSTLHFAVFARQGVTTDTHRLARLNCSAQGWKVTTSAVQTSRRQTRTAGEMSTRTLNKDIADEACGRPLFNAHTRETTRHIKTKNSKCAISDFCSSIADYDNKVLSSMSLVRWMATTPSLNRGNSHSAPASRRTQHYNKYKVC